MRVVTAVAGVLFSFLALPTCVLAQGTTVDWLAEVTDWKTGLNTGANGPIPWIVVDQFGYRTGAQKIAVIRDPKIGYDSSSSFTPGSTIALVDATTRRIVKQAAPVAWKDGAVDPYSGDRAWWFDFSDVTTKGRYVVVDVEKRIRTPEFSIADDVYVPVMRAALRSFYFQRAGFEKIRSLAGPWADKASHMGPGQDSEARPWPGTASIPQAVKYTGARDLRGGWYDAGDYNKYTSWTARVIIAILRGYAENPKAFDDSVEIPESGNGIPDVLDEMKWGLDWLIRMQNSDGSLLCVQALGRGSPPSSVRSPSYYGPPTTAASLMGAAVFAFASRIYAARAEPELKAFGAELADRAKRAWTWASDNPAVLYYNNDESKQPGSKGVAAGQQELDDAGRLLAKFEAALHLFDLTGDAKYKDFLDANYAAVEPSYGPIQWSMDTYELLLRYVQLDHVPAAVKTHVLTKFGSGMQYNQFQVEALRNKSDPYLAPMKDYTWGSNKFKSNQGRLFLLAARTFSGNELAETARRSLDAYVNYIHGVNPLGIVYLSNMRSYGASHYVTTMFHDWFFTGTRWSQAGPNSIGPAPGFLVGGPHASYKRDACCSGPKNIAGLRCGNSVAAEKVCNQSFQPPLQQPIMKSYLQFNGDWPANSWEITEPSTGYQSSYILLLSALIP